ncbi:hypothetical protein CTAYLR_002354 [Chrysophaeum taylorii]|uniref:Uncharacterized protein n=1 Tax=Chrysophaeum taylorii TaxID=2483200 RepID=A0AAD7UIU3_9STRA|nr:hypothetical protein CTAYLR_002354 [Chrysophaeum taylorii]
MDVLCRDLNTRRPALAKLIANGDDSAVFEAAGDLQVGVRTRDDALVGAPPRRFKFANVADAAAYLDGEYHRLLAPRADAVPAVVFLVLLSILFGVIFAPTYWACRPFRRLALWLFRSDAGRLRGLLWFTVACHVAEAATACYLSAIKLGLRPTAVLGWTVLAFVVGGAALGPLLKLAAKNKTSVVVVFKKSHSN